jgi:pimeloyl-ACP methyl ester carboxylesterase
MSLLTVGSFAMAMMLAAPGLLAGSAHGAEIAEASHADQSAVAPARVHPGADLRVDEFFVHVPPGAQEPLTALVVLHGMGGNGEDVSRPLLERADAERWVIVAPTFQYGDWRDPAQLTREAGAHMPRIAGFLDRLPDLTGLSVRKDALFYGFSRGGQTANRFALCYPERVAAVAMVSSGTYTLPFASVGSNDGDVAMPFPYGVSNFADLFGGAFDSSRFASVPFWVAVGSRDSDPADVPQQWTRYIGSDRVERAQRFTTSLREAGFNAEVHIYQGVGHGETDQIRAAALDFLKGSLPEVMAGRPQK